MKSSLAEDTYHLGIKALIRDRQGQVLLLRFSPKKMPGDVWDLPGGRVKRGETVEKTLMREVCEELGPVKLIIGVHIGMVLSSIRIPVASDDTGLILSIYECTLPQNVKLALSEDHDQYEWLEPSRAAELLQTKYPPEFCKLVAGLG